MQASADQLVVFARVVEAGSVTGAARALNITQPAVSSRLRNLQTLLGEQLYVPSRRGIELTEAGAALLPYARAVAHAMERASHAFAGAVGQPTRVSIAVSEAAVPLVVPLLVRVAFDDGGIELDLVPCDGRTAVAQVVAGEVELAVAVAQPDRPDHDLIHRPILTDEIVLVHRDPTLGASAPLAVLEPATLLWQARGSGVRLTAERALESAGVWPARVLEVGSTLGVLSAVAAGVGVGLLARRYVAVHEQAGAVRVTSLETSDLYARFELTAAPPDSLSPAARRVFDALQRS
jgi:DNA-binding transcriptional LysR family regulator